MENSDCPKEVLRGAILLFLLESLLILPLFFLLRHLQKASGARIGRHLTNFTNENFTKCINLTSHA